jgi:hypothetical protein
MTAPERITTMNVSQQIDKYIAEVGDGNTRDALNAAIARSEAVQHELQSLAKMLREQDDGWCTFCAVQLDRIAEIATPPAARRPLDAPITDAV